MKNLNKVGKLFKKCEKLEQGIPGIHREEGGQAGPHWEQAVCQTRECPFQGSFLAVSSSPAAGASARVAAAAGAEPMELGMIGHNEEGEEQDQMFCDIMGEETMQETNMWEDPDCQMFNAIDQSGKQTALCWLVTWSPEAWLLEQTKKPGPHECQGRRRQEQQLHWVWTKVDVNKDKDQTYFFSFFLSKIERKSE